VHCLVDELEVILRAFPMGDMLAHFTVGSLAPLHGRYTEYMKLELVLAAENQVAAPRKGSRYLSIIMLTST
jgi:hypothetical protein